MCLETNTLSPNPYKSYNTVYVDLRQHWNYILFTIIYLTFSHIYKRFTPPKLQKEQNLSCDKQAKPISRLLIGHTERILTNKAVAGCGLIGVANNKQLLDLDGIYLHN